MRSTHSW